MKLLETYVDAGAGRARLVGRIQQAGRPAGTPDEVYFAYPESFAHFLDRSADPFVPALLVPCMETGEPLELPFPVSSRLLRQTHAVQDFLLSLYPALRRVELRADADDAPVGVRAPNTATFFSGGVDSFYTLFRCADPGYVEGARPLTHLILVRSTAGADHRGFGAPTRSTPELERHQAEIDCVARKAGKDLIVAETNLQRRFGTLNWNLHYHGAALAAIALALSRGLGAVLISSSYAFGEVRRWGSHPLLDPLWSTDRLRVVHVGAEAQRTQKLVTVADQALAMHHLRVCLKNGGAAPNCGRCSKCVRTMLILELMGRLGEAETFPNTLPSDYAEILARDHEDYRTDILDFARRSGRRPDILRQLERFERRHRRRRAVRELMENTPLIGSSVPWIQRLRGRA